MFEMNGVSSGVVTAGLFMTCFSCFHMSPDYIITREGGCGALVEALLPWTLHGSVSAMRGFEFARAGL